MFSHDLLKLVQNHGYRQIPTADRLLRDAVVLDDESTDPGVLLELASIIENIEKNPQTYLTKKDQVELSDNDPGKIVCLSLWSDDVAQIEKFRALCRANLPKDMGWFHQCNSPEYQMFEFWRGQTDAMRNVASLITTEMKLPLVQSVQKTYRPDDIIPYQTFKTWDQIAEFTELGHFNGQ